MEKSDQLLEFYKKEYRIKTGRCLICDLNDVEFTETPSIEDIEKAVCEVFKCKPEELRLYRSSSVMVNTAKKFFYYTALQFYSSRQIGKYVGREGSTIRHVRMGFHLSPPKDFEKIKRAIKSKLNGK